MTEEIEKEIKTVREKLINHNVYSLIKSKEEVKRFMEFHMFAVWDFMSLLKALQRALTCVEIPWVPTPNPLTRRLINDIVLPEESDKNMKGEFQSHYEMYLDAMRELGADTSICEKMVKRIKDGENIHVIVSELDVPKQVKEFLTFTFTCIERGKIHEIAGAFTFGREDLIPDMFAELIKKLKGNGVEGLNSFIFYLDRHVELDGDEHGPMALNMINELCQDKQELWQEVAKVSKRALECRLGLWDAIEERILAQEK